MRHLRKLTAEQIDDLPLIVGVFNLEGPINEYAEIITAVCHEMYGELKDHTVGIGIGYEDLDRPRHKQKLKLSALIDRATDASDVARSAMDDAIRIISVHHLPEWEVSYSARLIDDTGLESEALIEFTIFPSAIATNEHALGDSGELGTFIRRVVAAMTRSPKCYSGFVSCSYADLTASGHLYGSTSLNCIDWERMIEARDWRTSGISRRERVRWPAWGVYLGPALAKRLDPDGSFKTRFLADLGKDQMATPFTQVHDEYSHGGRFLTVSKNPLDTYRVDATRAHGPEVHMGARLTQEFRRAGLL